MKARPADYLNCMLERELQANTQSPGKLRNTDHSLSFSLTQKDSNFKYLPDFMDSQRRSVSKNKENYQSGREDPIDLFSLQKHEPETSQQHRYSNSLLNEELVMLQSKLSNLEEKFLNMSTPEKPKKSGKVTGQFRKSQNQPTANTKSFIEPRRPNNDNTVKRREGASGKIQSTTRFSVMDKKKSRDSHYIGHINRVSKEPPVFDERSIDSIRSIERSKDKQIHQLKLEVSRCKNVCESSRVRKQRIENELEQLKEKVKQYKILERRQKDMLHENQRLTKQLHKSEVIRQKQKKMITEFKQELKELKEAIGKRKS